MTNVEKADKRQAGRRQGQRWQRHAGKTRCLFFKPRKWNLFAENWSDMVETVTDVVCAGAWSVSTGLRHTRWQTHVVHAVEKSPFLNAKEIKSGKKWREKKNDLKLISHPINVTEDTQHNIPACRDPGGSLGNEHMSCWPEPLDSIIKRFIEVKAKSRPVHSKGYWIADLFLGPLTERYKWYS